MHSPIPAFRNSSAALCGLSFLLAAGSARADIPAGCGPALETEFTVSTVVARSTGIDEPIKMDFDAMPGGVVDIYWVERKGKVKRFDGAAKTVIDLGTVANNNEFESGVSGILLDKAFKTNKRMFIFYSSGNAQAFEFRLSRFTLGGDGKLDLGSEKILLKVPAGFKKMHTGGGMAWDTEGNLFVTVGENEGGWAGPGNTNDLRGKILRIKPTEDGGYTIPAGNLFPPGTAKTKPEIYIMGVRNAYSLSYDPVLKGIMWGDVGPDVNGVTEEDNFAKAPGNYGYPGYAGNQVVIKGGGTPAAPKNPEPGTGLADLPPAKPGTYSYQQQCAVTGPIYRYDGPLDSKRKFPPHFDGRWFVTDCNNGQMDTLLLNANHDGVKSHARVFSKVRLTRPLDMKFGPDGALYVINYAGWFSADAATSIQRIDYTGSCLPRESIAVRGGHSAEREASRRRNLSLLRRGGGALIPYVGMRMIDGRAAAGTP